MNELRLTRNDRWFIVVCLILLAVGVLISTRYFQRAFPEASIDFRLNRPQSQRVAERFLDSLDLAPPSTYRHSSRFGYDGLAKTYLEKELGVEGARPYLGSPVRLWYWQHRWFRPGTKEEFRVYVSPEGDIVRLAHELPEEAAGATIPEADARATAESFLAGIVGSDSSRIEFIEFQRVVRPARTDWTFTYRARGIEPVRGSEYRYSVTVLGDRIGSYSEYLHVPEVWRASFNRLRSYNETAQSMSAVGMLLTAIAMIAVLFIRLRRRDIRWRTALAFGLVAAALTLLNQINNFPLRLYWYDTTTSWPGFLLETILYGLFQPLASGLIIFLITASAETLYREKYPHQPSLPRMFTPRALGTKSAFKGILLGVTLTAFFLAYQIVFYLIAGRFGAWSPSDVPYDNLLNTAMPWLAVLAIGFFPAVSEEFISRAFSIPFLQKVFRNRLTWLAVLVPAVIWGFGHSGYANQPFWIRGAEVGFAGIIIGVLMLRFGILPLLVWHYTVDALYTALLLFRSDNWYFVATAVVATGLLVIPLVAAFIAYLRRGSFVPEQGLLNADVTASQSAIARPVEAVPPAETATVSSRIYRSLPSRARILALILLAGGVAVALIPREKIGEFLKFDVEREAAIETFADSLRRAGWADPDTLKLAAFVSENDKARADDPSAYLLKHSISISEFNRIANQRLGVGRWRILAWQPENRLRYSGTVHAHSGRIESLSPLLPEEMPGDSFTKEQAQAVIESTLVAQGEDLTRIVLKEHHEQARPARLDHDLIYEAEADDARNVAEARFRRAGHQYGGYLWVGTRAFYKVPEEWQRDRRATTAPRALLRALNILVLAGLAVWGALLLAKRTRRGEVAWKRAFLLAIVPAIVIACGSASDLYLAQESYFYNIEQPWSVFRMDSIVQALISTVMFYVLFAMGIALITALYRDSWDDFRAASRKKAGWDALLTAGAVIGAVLMVQTARAVLNAAAPAWASFSGWNVPEWIAIPWPILGMAPDLLSSILLWAVSATLFAYLWCGPVKTFALRGLLVIAGVILLLPGRAVEPGEWLLAAGHGLLAVLLIYVVLRVIVGGRPVLFVAAIIATGLFTVAARGIAIGNATTALHIWLLIAFVAIGFSLWLLIPGRIRRT